MRKNISKNSFLGTILLLIAVIIFSSGFNVLPDNKTIDKIINSENEKDFIYKDGSIYRGNVDDKLNWIGEGAFYDTKGNIFIGYFNKGVLLKGRIIYSNKDIYEGDIVDFMAHGKGEIRFSNGDKYIGEFKYNKMEGDGFIMFSNTDTYKGQFKYGVFHGKGRYTKEGGLTQGLFEYGKYIKYLPTSEF